MSSSGTPSNRATYKNLSSSARTATLVRALTTTCLSWHTPSEAYKVASNFFPFTSIYIILRVFFLFQWSLAALVLKNSTIWSGDSKLPKIWGCHKRLLCFTHETIYRKSQTCRFQRIHLPDVPFTFNAVFHDTSIVKMDRAIPAPLQSNSTPLPTIHSSISKGLYKEIET